MKPIDITFVGHMCCDETIPYMGKPSIEYGGAILCSAVVPARIGKTCAIVVKMNPKDTDKLKPMEDLGVKSFVIPSDETTYIKVVHPSENVDVREFTLEKSAGIIKSSEMPDIDSKFVHLAGISDTEFDMELIKNLREKYKHLSIDMQSLVRHVDPVTRKIAFLDVANKKEIASLMDAAKLDIVEAKILTGTDNIEDAAKIFESWGCPETLITHSDGVLVRSHGKTYYEKFSNKSSIGRTGRGDTTFSAYLTWRAEHTAKEALMFASALVSIKMESIGPFNGTLEDVLKRIKETH